MWEFIFRVLGRDNSRSRKLAKERLRLVLVHDRASISPYLMNRLKEDLMGVISNYMIVDEDEMDLHLNQNDREVTLVANIPIKQIRRDYMERSQISS